VIMAGVADEQWDSSTLPCVGVPVGEPDVASSLIDDVGLTGSECRVREP
jgi:hypothetical protein